MHHQCQPPARTEQERLLHTLPDWDNSLPDLGKRYGPSPPPPPCRTPTQISKNYSSLPKHAHSHHHTITPSQAYQKRYSSGHRLVGAKGIMTPTGGLHTGAHQATQHSRRTCSIATTHITQYHYLNVETLGGTRPFALMPMLYRLWSKIRRPYLTEWERAHQGPWDAEAQGSYLDSVNKYLGEHNTVVLFDMEEFDDNMHIGTLIYKTI